MDGGEAKSLDIKVPATVDASKAPDALASAKPEATPEPVEDLAVDIESYRVSPDGVWIAFIARDPETPGEKKQKEAKADAEWVDNDPHGARLYLFRRDTSLVTPVPLSNDVREIAWRNDCSGLLAVVEAPNSASDLGFARSSWVVELGDREHPKKLATIPASYSLY
jgi:hypothetical protein